MQRNTTQSKIELPFPNKELTYLSSKGVIGERGAKKPNIVLENIKTQSEQQSKWIIELVPL